MKRAFARYLIAVFFCAAATLVFANEFKSEIIISAGPALTISVPDEHFLRIRNFTQQGGTERGVVMVMKMNGQTANVLAASRIDNGPSPTPIPTPSPTPTPTPTPSPIPLEVINSVVIAGPAIVTIKPVPGATLFVTFRKDRDSD